MLRSAPKLHFFLTYTFISVLIAATGGQHLDQQMPFSPPNHSQGRPSWSTLPVSNPTKSFWIDDPNANPLAREGSSGPLGFGDEEVDVCIIGSGMTGVSSAYHLQRFFGTQKEADVERKIVILEAREFCSGATGRNGGHLAPSRFGNYANRERLYGKEDARKTYALEDYVVSSIVDIIDRHGWTEVDLVNGGTTTVFVEEGEERKALIDFEDAKKGGLKLSDIKFVGRETMREVYGVDYSAVFSPRSYNLWPLKFVSNLYNLSTAANALVKIKLHTLTPVTSITPLSKHLPTSGESHKWKVKTPRGSLVCKTVIHATNAYASYLLPQFHDRIIPTRGQIFAVRAKTSLDRLKHHAWQANWGYEYWFPRPEERSGNSGEDPSRPPLVILGGGRDTAGPGLDQYTMDDSVLNDRVSKTLKDFLPNLFAGTGLFEAGKEAEMEWTGIMGFTKNGVPIIGQVEGLPGQYIAAGFTGHGMPRAFAAAEVISGMIVAKLTETEWNTPEWLPRHYLMS